MNRLAFLLFWIGALASLAIAASAPTFCKCTCFSNSTIIEIKSKSTSGTSSHLKEEGGSSSNDDEAETPTSSTPSATPDLPDDNEAPTTTTDGAAAAAAADDDDEAILSFPSSSDDTTPLSDLPQSPQTLFHATNRRAAAAKPHRRAQLTSPSCSQCNRAFCLSQSLPICKGASEKDVVTMCFQRDSRKDQIVVWGFILGTAGLLGWAALRRAVEMQENGAFLGAAAALFGGGGGSGAAGSGGGIGGRSAAGGGGGGGGGGVGSGITSRLGLGRTTSSGDWRGQYASVATHSRQNSVAPLMGDHN